MKDIITAENVSFYYENGKMVLDDFSYSFKKGNVYVINGQSGSGKTTLISLLAGLEIPKLGKIIFNETNLNDMDKYYYRSHSIGMVFQSYNLINKYTAVENIELAMDLANEKPNDRINYITKLLEDVGIPREEINRRVIKLSGGQQQRVAIARALCHNSDIILADEPTGNLDEKNAIEIMNIFLGLAHECEKCVVVVSHSSLVTNLADCVVEI